MERGGVMEGRCGGGSGQRRRGGSERVGRERVGREWVRREDGGSCGD